MSTPTKSDEQKTELSEKELDGVSGGLTRSSPTKDHGTRVPVSPSYDRDLDELEVER